MASISEQASSGKSHLFRPEDVYVTCSILTGAGQAGTAGTEITFNTLPRTGSAAITLLLPKLREAAASHLKELQHQHGSPGGSVIDWTEESKAWTEQVHDEVQSCTSRNPASFFYLVSNKAFEFIRSAYESRTSVTGKLAHAFSLPVDWESPDVSNEIVRIKVPDDCDYTAENDLCEEKIHWQTPAVEKTRLLRDFSDAESALAAV